MNNAIMLAGARIMADTGVFTKIAAVLKNFYSQMLIVATPVAVLAIAFCAFKMFLASDPQSVKSAKNWLITIAIGLLILLLAEPLVTTVSSIVTG